MIAVLLSLCALAPSPRPSPPSLPAATCEPGRSTLLERRAAASLLLLPVLRATRASAEVVVNPYAPNYVEPKKNEGGGFVAAVGNFFAAAGFLAVIGWGAKTVFDLGKANDEAGDLFIGDNAFNAPSEREILDAERTAKKQANPKRNFFDLGN